MRGQVSTTSATHDRTNLIWLLAREFGRTVSRTKFVPSLDQRVSVRKLSDQRRSLPMFVGACYRIPSWCAPSVPRRRSICPRYQIRLQTRLAGRATRRPAAPTARRTNPLSVAPPARQLRHSIRPGHGLPFTSRGAPGNTTGAGLISGRPFAQLRVAVVRSSTPPTDTAVAGL